MIKKRTFQRLIDPRLNISVVQKAVLDPTCEQAAEKLSRPVPEENDQRMKRF
jgi:hypothetical protein